MDEIRVLLVEDDPRLAEMLIEVLGGRGFQVRHVMGVKAAWGELRKNWAELVLLDVMLPDGDGFDLCRQIRGESDLPVVMITARGEDTDRIVGLELGADDYLPKPFNPRELVARMRAVLRRCNQTQTQIGGVLRFGELEIDRGEHVVRLGGARCDLTAFQVDLIRVLAENAGRALSRERLSDLLRGETYGPFDRSIDVHISRIRAVIEEDARRPRRIQTVRGVGYLFARLEGDENPA